MKGQTKKHPSKQNPVAIKTKRSLSAGSHIMANPLFGQKTPGTIPKHVPTYSFQFRSNDDPADGSDQTKTVHLLKLIRTLLQIIERAFPGALTILPAEKKLLTEAKYVLDLMNTLIPQEGLTKKLMASGNIQQIIDKHSFGAKSLEQDCFLNLSVVSAVKNMMGSSICTERTGDDGLTAQDMAIECSDVMSENETPDQFVSKELALKNKMALLNAGKRYRASLKIAKFGFNPKMSQSEAEKFIRVAEKYRWIKTIKMVGDEFSVSYIGSVAMFTTHKFSLQKIIYREFSTAYELKNLVSQNVEFKTKESTRLDKYPPHVCALYSLLYAMSNFGILYTQEIKTILLRYWVNPADKEVFRLMINNIIKRAKMSRITKKTKANSVSDASDVSKSEGGDSFCQDNNFAANNFSEAIATAKLRDKTDFNQMIFDNQPFLKFVFGETHPGFAYYTVEMLGHIQNGKFNAFFIDGTHIKNSKCFNQLVIVRMLSQDRDEIVTACYVLLQNKTCETYTKLFMHLKTVGFFENAEFVMTDFELAFKNALKKCIPTIKTRFCLFHLQRSFKNYARSINKITKNHEFFDILKGDVYPYVPILFSYLICFRPKFSRTMFFVLLKLCQQLSANDATNLFSSYVYSNYIVDSARFKEGFYADLQAFPFLTNNFVEGTNSAFKRFTSKRQGSKSTMDWMMHDAKDKIIYMGEGYKEQKKTTSTYNQVQNAFESGNPAMLTFIADKISTLGRKSKVDIGVETENEQAPVFKDPSRKQKIKTKLDFVSETNSQKQLCDLLDRTIVTEITVHSALVKIGNVKHYVNVLNMEKELCCVKDSKYNVLKALVVYK